MNCSQIRTHLKDYLEDHISPQLKATITGHLSSCTECSGELTFLKRYLPQVETIAKIAAPTGFEVRLQRKLRKTEDPHPIYRKRFFALPVPVTAFASILIVGILIFYLTNPLQLIKNNNLVKTPAPAGDTLSTGNESQTPAADSVATKQMKAERNVSLSPVAEKKTNGLLKLTLSVKSANPSASKESVANIESQKAAPQLYGRMSESATDEGTPEVLRQKENETNVENDNNSLIDQIQTVVKNLGGDMDNIKNKSSLSPDLFLKIKIPAKNYQQFFDAIAKYGEIQKPYPVIRPEEEGIIEINLQLHKEN